MISRLQALLSRGRLHLPKTAEAEALRRELAVYELRVDAQARETFGAFKTGTHDDLVTALGLAIQVGSPLQWGLLPTPALRPASELRQRRGSPAAGALGFWRSAWIRAPSPHRHLAPAQRLYLAESPASATANANPSR